MDIVKSLSVVLLVSRAKKIARFILGPFLPLIRSARTLPKRVKTQRIASRLIRDRGLSVCYLTSQFPHRPALRTEISHGGAVKLTFLAESFPHSYPQASLLYAVSSVDHVAKKVIVQKAKENGLKIVLNQNGVAYPAWHGKGWEEPNRKMREIHEQADFVIYQSEFCRLGAEKFLGKCAAPYRVIYNPVDLALYTPIKQPAHHTAPILLLGGNQLASYRMEVAAKILSQLIKHLPNSRLIVTGKLWGDNQSIAMHEAISLLRKSNITGQVEFTGQYSQEDAVRIFQQADILIHTQYNDASPTLIGEALACGIPVVFSSSGGTPELVGPEAGIGIPVEKSWEKINLPDPQKMAEAVVTIWEKHQQYAEAARQWAVENFALEKYFNSHQELFTRLLN